jgi:hypothetical protein
MPTWLSVLLVIAVVIAVGMLRERRRLGRVAKWSEPRGFTELSPMPPDMDTCLREFIAKLESNAFRGWGLALQGQHEGALVTLTEYRVSGGHKTPDRWRSLAALQMPWTEAPLAVRAGFPEAMGTAGRYVLIVRDKWLAEPALDGLLAAVSQGRKTVQEMGDRPTA